MNLAHGQSKPDVDFANTPCDFIRTSDKPEEARISLAAFVEPTPITLASSTPVEMVVQMFQKMVPIC